MSRVQYNSSRLIPAPYVSISKQYTRSQDGTVIGKVYSIQLRGRLFAYKGSPDSTGTFWTVGGYPADESISNDARLGTLLRKQEALRRLFSDDGKSLEIQSADGSQPLKCNPRVISIDIPDGQWYNDVEYTINLEADKLYPELDNSLDSSSMYLEDASESWSIESNEDSIVNLNGDKTYSLRHNVSAKGRLVYDETGAIIAPAWHHARNYVVSKLGFDSQIALSSGVLRLPSYYNGYNLVRSEELNETDGTFSVSEAWVLSSGNAIETFEIKVDNGLESPYRGVTIDGSVNGFEVRNSDMSVSSTKWTNALAKFAEASGLALTRAQAYSGLTLNVIPLNFTQAINPNNGVINYSLSYDTRPSRLIPNSRSESISISDNNRGDVFAAIFAIGRSRGPVLQSLSATTEASRTLNIELLVTPPTYSDNSISSLKTLMNNNPRFDSSYSGAIDNIITAANPLNNGFSVSYRSQPQESWDFLNGRYSYNITWTYE